MNPPEYTANLKIIIGCTPTYTFSCLAGMQTFTSNLRLFLVLSLSVKKGKWKHGMVGKKQQMLTFNYKTFAAGDLSFYLS